MELSKKVIVSLPIKSQHFPFLPTFLKYILQNSSPKLLLKLYICCKYFYFKSKITIAPNVEFQNYPKEKAIKFRFYDKSGRNLFDCRYIKTAKLWLTDELFIICFPESYRKSCELNGTELLNRIYRNNLRKLDILSGFTLLFTELEILCKSPYLTEVELFSMVKNENDEPIPIEKIMVLLPHVKNFFRIAPSYFTLESFNKLIKFKFSNKFQQIRFGNVKTKFDPISLCKFLKDNFDENPEFDLTFVSYHLKNQLLPPVKEIFNGWETKKPIYSFYD